jgi:hypothetical protein
MSEMDFDRYAGQLRPWTQSDALLVWELEKELIEELDRAEARTTVCDCYYCVNLRGCTCYYCVEMKGKPWPSSAPTANER